MSWTPITGSPAYANAGTAVATPDKPLVRAGATPDTAQKVAQAQSKGKIRYPYSTLFT